MKKRANKSLEDKMKIVNNYVLVEKGLFTLILNCLQRDIDDGKIVRQDIRNALIESSINGDDL